VTGVPLCGPIWEVMLCSSEMALCEELFMPVSALLYATVSLHVYTLYCCHKCGILLQYVLLQSHYYRGTMATITTTAAGAMFVASLS